MKTVLIAGAGATRAEAMSRGATSKQRPPLDTDFFQCSELQGLEGHRSRIGDFTQENFGLQLFRPPRPRMEEVFSHVYTSTSITPIPSGAKAAFGSLCRLYATVIANTTNWLQPSRKGPLCRLIHDLAKDGDLEIVTFNQDVIIEKALQVLTEAERSAVEWYPDDGYEMSFEKLTFPRGPAPVFGKGGSRSSQVTLLKLHGSLNWFAKTVKQDKVLSSLSPSQKIFCTRRLNLSTEMTYTQPTQSGLGRKKWYTWPIIAPPVVDKGAFLGRALASVWRRAWDALVGAERIVVYGYSFPDADMQSRTFFLRAANSQSRHPVLVTLNPDVNSAVRAAQIFVPHVHVIASSVRDYLKGR